MTSNFFPFFFFPVTIACSCMLCFLFDCLLLYLLTIAAQHKLYVSFNGYDLHTNFLMESGLSSRLSFHEPLSRKDDFSSTTPWCPPTSYFLVTILHTLTNLLLTNLFYGPPMMFSTDGYTNLFEMIFLAK